MKYFQTEYLVTLKDGTTRRLSLAVFRRRFPSAGPNFKARLEQIKQLFPSAVDWEMVDLEPK